MKKYYKFWRYRKVEYISVMCNCGCNEGIVFQKLDGEIFVSFVTGDFYVKQGMLDNLKFGLDLFFGKKLIKEMYITETELIKIRDYITSPDFKEVENPDNNSHITIGYEDYIGYTIELISDMPKKEALKFKNHRLFEIVFSKKDRDKLVRKIDKMLEKHKDDHKLYV
jgi:hypothetical protein